MVHRRELTRKVLVFGNQGDLYKNAMTWWDHDTGSVWSQPLGRAILGPRKGEELEVVPSTLTEWSSWRRAHPDTFALDADAGGAGFDLADMLIAVQLSGETKGYPVPLIRKEGVINDSVAGEPLAVVIHPDDPQQWAVFSRELDGRVVTLELRRGLLVDGDGGGRWDPATGLVAGNPSDPGILLELPAFTSFPSDFRNFYPDSAIY
jgi:hypothetical protein